MFRPAGLTAPVPPRESTCVRYVTYSHHSFLDLSKVFIFPVKI